MEKYKKLMKTIRIILLSVVIGCFLAIVPTTSMAQDRPNTTTESDDDDNDTDYGWIGLIGLAGLLGLRKRDRDDRDIKGRV